MKDEVLEKLWLVKDALAHEANYDVQVLCQELKKRQTASKAQIVDRSVIAPVPAKTQPATGARK